MLESLFGEYENLTINLQLEEELLSWIVDVAKEKCLTTSKKFVDKVMQLYYVSQVNHGGILFVLFLFRRKLLLPSCSQFY